MLYNIIGKKRIDIYINKLIFVWEENTRSFLISKLHLWVQPYLPGSIFLLSEEKIYTDMKQYHDMHLFTI